ncbi:MAG TPA: GNAT family N-acetyltransferase [Trueperaceae bacterium]|nr:GNAT family N-acetyltransferase [Trueperaceae bacterium]
MGADRESANTGSGATRGGANRGAGTGGADATGIVVREPEGMEELRALEALQLEVWGFEAIEAVPAAHIRATQHAGGMVLGAFANGRLAGFAYGFAALPHGPWERGTGVHSHMVAVRPAFQGTGVGRRLKWAQRTWCLERGIDWMTWTFDPMQARNARLNFHHLGARSREYLIDFYGTMPGALGGNQASDRLLAFWDLRDEGVSQRAGRFTVGLGPEAEPLPDAAWILERGVAGEPLARPAADGARALRVAVPEDATRLLGSEPQAAARWRHAVREALEPRVGRGYLVTAFEGGAYLLERERAPRNDR